MTGTPAWTTVRTIAALLAAGVLLGCAHVPNHYREDGPATKMAWDSPTATDVKARHQPLEPRSRGWEPAVVRPASGAVVHWPLYFEDPFEDKGHGRTDATHPHDVYRLGWEDWVAIPYGISRFTLNWLMLPVSAVVTPPCTPLVSDGKVSKQLLWYDHDATPLRKVEAEPPTPAQPTPAPTAEPTPPAPTTA